MTMTDKLTPKSMEDQYDHQLETFKRKNSDYGNSFEKSLDAFGLVAGIVRMNDKMERLVSLNGSDKGAHIASESLVDTLEDLSNYAAMAACWLKGKKVEDWKDVHLKELDHAIDVTKIKAGISSQNGVSSFDLEPGDIVVMPKKVSNPKQFIRDCINAITDTALMKENKDQLLVYMDISDDAGRMAKCIIDNNISRNIYMSIISNYWHKHANIPVPLRDFIIGVIERHIYYMKKVHDMAKALDNHHMNANKIKAVPLLGGENEEDRKIAETAKHIDDMLEDIRKRSGGSIETRFIRNPFRHKPDFDIKLNLEPYLKEHSKKCDEKRLDQAIDLFKYNAAAQAKTQEDIDELFERMLDGSLVSRVVSNGDGTFVAYWEPAEKEEDDED